MDRYKVIVSTIGALSDRRVMGWNKGKNITTVFVDEIGQIKQPEIPFLFMFEPNRTVLIGDHMQRQPFVNSISATRAGLNICCMQWLDMG